MTYEEYTKKNAELNKLVYALRQEIKDNYNSYLESNREFADGEKVLVTYGEISQLAFISAAKVSGINGRIRYGFRKCKKDGTMGNVSAGIYWYDKIEKA